MSAPSTYVYFIRRIDGVGPIKIGCSDLPTKRLQDLMFWSPVDLEILVTISGTLALEANIHDCFFHDYMRHEWFRPSAKLVKLVGDLRCGVPIERALDLSARLGNVRQASRSAYRQNNVPPTAHPLRRHRLELGLTQGAMARRLGVSLGTLSGWERGRNASNELALHIERATAGAVPAAAMRAPETGAAA